MMTAEPSYLVGIDVGGTFTDILAYDAARQRMLSAKVPSLPGQQWRGVLDALAALGIPSGAIRAFVHGTTIATNALLERKGAPTGLVTTQGFRDVLEIGKARRLNGGLFDITWDRSPPIVPRHLRAELPERTDATGSVVRPAELDRLAAIVDAFRTFGVESVAVAFINSYLNHENEVAVADRIRALLPGVFVSPSAELVAERGEFERTSTCVLNAYLTPTMAAYLGTLTASLAERGVTASVNIMGSNGGAMTLAQASRRVVGTFLSGPVGGINGATRVAEMAGVKDLITFDMGGTSTDVALVHQLKARMSYDNQVDAYPLQMPQLDMHTIGAGGGSVVWIGADGTLQVGPRSAGAVPGPACYGRGGAQPTISDANLLLGRLPTQRPISGGLTLDLGLAKRAFEPIATALGARDLTEVADSALRIAVAKMAGAVREVSVHRGFDPSDFTLVGYGGAGPMHIFHVAEELGVRKVLVPRFPGHLCALGQMLANIRRDSVAAWTGRLTTASPSSLKEKAEAMRTEAARCLTEDGIPEGRHDFLFTLDMRYVGQSFALQIEWDSDSDGWATVRAAFDARHIETFGYATPENDVEVVNVRLVALGRVDTPELHFEVQAHGDTLLERRSVWFDSWFDCPVYLREAMRPSQTFAGPAIVEEAGGTSVIPPGWNISVHTSGALLCERDFRTDRTSSNVVN
jgi:N-methylhydantoinase A